MECERGTNVGQGSLVSLALADYCAPRKAKRIRDISVRVPLYDDFEWWGHGTMMDGTRPLSKRSKSPKGRPYDPTQAAHLTPATQAKLLKRLQPRRHPRPPTRSTSTSIVICYLGGIVVFVLFIERMDQPSERQRE